ncbi:helix-turn-helix transcriptional regulator [Streptosporangium sandarakinum]|uniref:helix-turn-helix transcriptional regulator n=2 Tax=Streptosporangium sandarakinum TaxID=1260955 RepID=UPI003D8F069B
MSMSGQGPSWTFLTHHARVLLKIARDPEARLRDVAQSIGITERAVQGIVADLHEAGYLTRRRVGRRNHYQLNLDHSFRYPTEAHAPVRTLVDLFASLEPGQDPPAAAEGDQTDLQPMSSPPNNASATPVTSSP